MANQKLQTTFANTYNDDYSDSDNYYKVLFNNARSLQQRELNQLQTIIQTDLKINSDFTYKHGQAAVGGATQVKNKVNFIKLNTDPTASGTALPAIASIEGFIFTQQSTPAIKFRVNKVVAASGSDPAVIYVTYVDGADQDGTANEGILPTAGATFSGNSETLTVQSTNTTTNPASGHGTIFEVDAGKFYLEGHFVHTAKQELILSKFTSTYSGTVGFNVTEDIVTTADDNDLFDNSGATINTASPGADRYRIRLTLIDKTDTVAGDYFFPIAEIARGILFRDNVQANSLEARDLTGTLAQRTREESGNYITGRMLVDFETNADSATKIDAIITPSTAYVNGFRHQYTNDIPIPLTKPRTTKSINNTTTAANYGNYVLVTTMKGIFRIDQLSQINLKDQITHGGNTIGVARPRAIEKDGNNYRVYLFDVIMAAGKNFAQVRSIGTSNIIYGDVDLTNTGVANQGGNVAVLRDAGNNNLFFEVSRDRPKALTDITLTTQHRVVATANGSGVASLTASSLIGSGYVFTDASSWIVAATDDGVIDDGGDAVVTIASGGASATVNNLETSQEHAFIVYAQKTATVRAKTLTTVGATAITPSTIGGKANSISLGKTDIYDIVSITKSSVDISDRYILDKGQQDNFYDVGKLILKAGAAAPSGDVTVSFRYFAHATNGDFFAVNSYDGQVTYEDIPSHRTKSGEDLSLREVLDFRSSRATNGINFHTGTNAQVVPIPANNDLITYDLSFYLGQKGIAYVHKSGRVGVELGDAEEFPKYPILDDQYLKLARVHLFPYTLTDEDLYVSHIDNKRYTMRDIGNIEKRIDQIEELTALNLLETETANIDVLDSAGNNRLKAGITADNFKNHFQSDTTLPGYKAAIDPARNELRPEFVARPIELVYDNGASSNVVLKGDKVMLTYSEVTWREQSSASRMAIVNPFGTERHTGTIVMSPASDNWSDKKTSVRVTKGDTTFDVGEGKLFGDWDFNWSGITNDELDNFKTGDIVGERVVSGGTYKRRTAYQEEANMGNGTVTRYRTSTYNKNTYQNYNVSGISTVRETIGTKVKSILSVEYMRSRFISFKATGLRPSTEYFSFFNGINVSAFMNTSEGTGAFVRWASLARTSPYLEVDNVYNSATGYPSALGGATAKMLTDANGAISGYFLLPNTDGVTTGSGNKLRFKSGRQTFSLLDISAYNINNATSIAEFIYEANGVIKEVEESVRESRVVQIGSATANRDGEVVRPNQFTPDGPDTTPDWDGQMDHSFDGPQ